MSHKSRLAFAIGSAVLAFCFVVLQGCAANNPSAEDAKSFYSQQGAKDSSVPDLHAKQDGDRN